MQEEEMRTQTHQVGRLWETQGDDGHLRAGGNSPVDTVISDFQPLDSQENRCLSFGRPAPVPGHGNSGGGRTSFVGLSSAGLHRLFSLSLIVTLRDRHSFLACRNRSRR